MSFNSIEFLSLNTPSESVSFLKEGANVFASGDFNGDGLDDIVIGAPSDGRGEVVIIFGADDEATPLDAINNVNGLIISGRAVNIIEDPAVAGEFGTNRGDISLAVGDFDGDGLDDLAIGDKTMISEAGVNFFGPTGGVHVVFGAAINRSTINLATLDAAQGFTIEGDFQDDDFGASIAAGDFNGDGVDDLLVGAPGSANNAGDAYLFHNAANLPDGVVLRGLSAADATVLDGDFESTFGTSVANAGDFDNDGQDDLLIGAPDAGLAAPVGSASVVFGPNSDRGDTAFGRNFNTIRNAQNADKTHNLQNDSATGDFGGIVSSVGDIDGDGFDDVAIVHNTGAYATATGGIFIMFGGPRGFNNDLRTDQTANPALAELTISDPVEALAGIGDINGDGFDDFMASGKQVHTVILGGRNIRNTLSNDANLYGANGFKLVAERTTEAAVSAVGDFNRDGRDDFILTFNDDISTVVFGRPVISGPIFGQGSRGGQRILGSDEGDFLNGLGGDDELLGLDGDDNINGSNGNDDVNGGNGDDVVFGDTGDDTLDGAAGDDELFGGSGNDQLFGGAGDDALEGGARNDLLAGGLGRDDLTGESGNDRLGGGSQDDVLDGGDGNDLLNGGHGADDMSGGDGDDKYTVDNLGDIVREASGGGTDLIQSLLSEFDLRTVDNIENLTAIGRAAAPGAAFHGIGTDGANIIIGGAGDNILEGLGGDDRLDGKAGADLMIGGDGDDRFVVDNLGDITEEIALGGHDTVEVIGGLGSTHAMGAFIEDAVLAAGTATIIGNAEANHISVDLFGGSGVLSGNGGNDILLGGRFADTLDGGSGTNFMAGGAGNDIYLTENSLDILVEQAGAGLDTVFSQVDHALGANFETLVLLGDAITGTGNDLDNKILGNAGDNRLTGGAGDNVLDGRDGNDLYVIENVFGQSNTIVERANGGHDTVAASSSAILADNVEDLIITSAGGHVGTGNGLDNVITGGDGADQLLGEGGNDVLHGGDSADLLAGGTGNDTYHIDNAADFITENVGEGIDSVISGFDHILSINVENLTLAGQAISGTGNAEANKIAGTDTANNLFGEQNDDQLFGLGGDDLLDGGEGADQMSGGLGDDRYLVDNAGDTVKELAGGGIDTVALEFGGGFNGFLLGGAVENAELTAGSGTVKGNAEDNRIEVTTGQVLFGDGGIGEDILIGGGLADRLTGGIGRDQLIGNDGSDRLFGQSGDDLIIGGAGNDVMAGQFGADIFEFNAGSGQDVITDFTLGEDLIVIGADVGIADFATLSAGFEADANDNARIQFNGGDQLVLVGVSKGDLAVGDFGFA